MRLYAFLNYYLSPLQHGLQTAHCVGDMSIAYKHNTAQHEAFTDWVTNHKTIIICNGGNSEALRVLYYELLTHYEQLRLPVVRFHEDGPSLNGALTAVATVVPPWVYESSHVDQHPVGPAYIWNSTASTIPITLRAGTPEYALTALIRGHRLA